MNKPMEQPIAVFDSGVGGISVLQELRRLMPQEDYLFFGDTAHAPYGERSTEEVRALTAAHCETLLRQGAKALVVACNTATSAAAETLRAGHPEVPIIGMEPALKPAVLAFPGGRIIVMATVTTLREEKFNRLLNQYRDRAEIIPLPGAGLVELIEHGVLDGPQLEQRLRQLLLLYHDADAVVLGCTHYPFIRRAIQAQLDHAAIFDGGAGTARETQRRLREIGLCRPAGRLGQVSFASSSSDPAALELMRRLAARTVVTD